jgi:transposase InsO family protein
LKENQIELPERFSPKFRERYIEAPLTRALVAIDTFFCDVFKGVAKVYLQTAIDCHSNYACARPYTSKLPITVVHIMNHYVIPSLKEQNARIKVVLSDNGGDFSGRPDKHPFELYLQLENIEHRTTRVKRIQSNSIIERFQRILLDEHFRIESRRTWLETIDEMQKVLEEYLVTYNISQSRQGRGINGTTPITIFKAECWDAKPNSTKAKRK